MPESSQAGTCPIALMKNYLPQDHAAPAWVRKAIAKMNLAVQQMQMKWSDIHKESFTAVISPNLR